jgi:hypothetical protein
MKKKIFFLALALTAAFSAQLLADRPPFDPGECYTFCPCPDDPTFCYTCCTWTVCAAPACL